MKVSGSKFNFLILYVDDILLAVNDVGLLHEQRNFSLRTLNERYGRGNLCDWNRDIL